MSNNLDIDIMKLTLPNGRTLGYHVSKGWHKDIENFGYREGGHFLENAVYRFNKENDFGIDIIINY